MPLMPILGESGKGHCLFEPPAPILIFWAFLIGFDSPGTLDPPTPLGTLLEWLSQPVPQAFPFILCSVKNPVLSSFLQGALIR